jgi:dinuclear metal center YbgI/SA1388 family protein
MHTIGEILQDLCRLAPLESKMDFDNVGLLAGDEAWPVQTVLLSLDITGEVIREAETMGAGLIVSHHPLFFSLKAVEPRSAGGLHTLELLTRRIGAVCMHTNLDAADGGVNDALADAIGLSDALPFEPEHVCRIGSLPEPESLPRFLARVKNALGCQGLRYAGSRETVCRIAVGGGSCGDMLEEAFRAGCDAFVTADVKHDVFLRAAELGFVILDAGHFYTENVVIPVLQRRLQKSFPDLRVCVSAHSAPESYFM